MKKSPTKPSQLFSGCRTSVSRHLNPLAIYHFGIWPNWDNLLPFLGFQVNHPLSRVGTACRQSQFARERLRGSVTSSITFIAQLGVESNDVSKAKPKEQGAFWPVPSADMKNAIIGAIFTFAKRTQRLSQSADKLNVCQLCL